MAHDPRARSAELRPLRMGAARTQRPDESYRRSPWEVSVPSALRGCGLPEPLSGKWQSISKTSTMEFAFYSEGS
jgi:hypothetical protein